MFMYSYCFIYVFSCYVCSVVGSLFYCVLLCIVFVSVCTVLPPPSVDPIADNKYIIYLIISYHFILKGERFICDFFHKQTHTQLVRETSTFRGI